MRATTGPVGESAWIVEVHAGAPGRVRWRTKLIRLTPARLMRGNMNQWPVPGMNSWPRVEPDALALGYSVAW